MTRIVHVELPANHTLALFGDTHYGARSFDQDVVDLLTARMKRSSSFYAWHMGDVAEAIQIDDKRYHRSEHGATFPDPVLQYAKAKEDLAKMPRLLGILEGNHDRKLSRTGDFLREMCRSQLRGVAYGTYSTKLHIHVGDLTYKLFLWHGAGAPPRTQAKDPIQRRGNRQAAIMRRLAAQHSDCHVMAMGHYHFLEAFRAPGETVLYDDGRKLHMDRPNAGPMDIAELQDKRSIDPNLRWYAVTGTAKKSREAFETEQTGVLGVDEAYSTWEETMGFPPADLGWVEVRFRKGLLELVPVYYDGGETR